MDVLAFDHAQFVIDHAQSFDKPERDTCMTIASSAKNPFIRSGAAVCARSSMGIGNEFSRDRHDNIRKEPGLTDETVYLYPTGLGLIAGNLSTANYRTR